MVSSVDLLLTYWTVLPTLPAQRTAKSNFYQGNAFIYNI